MAKKAGEKVVKEERTPYKECRFIWNRINMGRMNIKTGEMFTKLNKIDGMVKNFTYEQRHSACSSFLGDMVDTKRAVEIERREAGGTPRLFLTVAKVSEYTPRVPASNAELHNEIQKKVFLDKNAKDLMEIDYALASARNILSSCFIG